MYVEAWLQENPHPCTGTIQLPIICRRFRGCKEWADGYAAAWDEEMKA